MGEYDEEIDTSTENDSPLVKQLRGMVKDLTKKVHTAEQAARGSILSDALRGKGVLNAAKIAKAVKLFPTDQAPTEENVTAWITEYGDLFGVGAAVAAPVAAGDGEEPAAEPTGKGVDPAVQEQWTAAQNTEAGGTVNATIGATGLKRELADIRSKNLSFDQTMKALGGRDIPVA